MKIPEFTANASLYQSKVCYRMKGAPSGQSTVMVESQASSICGTSGSAVVCTEVKGYLEYALWGGLAGGLVGGGLGAAIGALIGDIVCLLTGCGDD